MGTPIIRAVSRGLRVCLMPSTVRMQSSWSGGLAVDLTRPAFALHPMSGA